MTRIDFYILAEQSHRNVEQLTCQLTEKAYLQNNFIYIHSKSVEQANSIDELLWKYKADSFLPHANQLNMNQEQTDNFDYPIVINVSNSITDTLNCEKRSEFLINMTNTTPAFFSQFHRLAEIVDKDEKSKQDARERFRFYKERGYEIATHNV
ncbi:MAG: DNA polymerase III subunit chi [Pseudomonadota bacterium]